MADYDQGLEITATDVEKEKVETPEKVVDIIDETDLKKAVIIENRDDSITTDPPMRATIFGPLYFNHVTSFIGIAFLWGLSTWCMVDPEGSKAVLIEWRGDSAQYFSWFYIGTRPLFFFFIVYIAVFYGDIRLGHKNSKPEFSTLTYFTMLFAAGVAVGLFFYGVSEPLWHRASHWYANAGYHSQDEIDQFAITLTLYHWGLAAWAGYVLVAICVGLAAYRWNLPMTFRSGLYPILGAYTWGWIGDFIDGFTIVVTVAGVCTSLGLGAMQIQQGLQRVNWIEDSVNEEESRNIQITIIWCITVIATISVVSGLDIGIKYLSNLAFCLGQILLFWVFVSDNTAYLMNLMVQSCGHYIHFSTWWLNFYTDAFGQLRTGEGRAPEGSGAIWWMDAWTIFYMAWWTAWSGFVGLFVARISKGRTVREVCLMGTIVPMTYEFLWFCTFGGIGIRQARQADELVALGKSLFNDTAYYQNSEIDYCYNVPQEDVFDADGKLAFTNYVPGVTPVCQFSSGDANNAWFNVLFSYSFPNDFDIGFGYFFSVVSIFAISIYFITSSDSGSLIVDHLASNGKEEHFWGQRVFWSFTEGAVASALLVAGGADALQALQAASILAGLPFTVIMCYMIQSTLVMCQQARANPDSMELVIDNVSGKGEFKTPIYGGIFNVFEFLFSFGLVHERRVELGLDLPKKEHIVGFFVNAVAPFIALNKVQNANSPRTKIGNTISLVSYTLMFIAWIGLFISVSKSEGLRVFGWTAYFICGVILTGIKFDFREKHGLRGNIIGDFLSSLFFYPQVLFQLSEQCDILGLPYSKDDEEEPVPEQVAEDGDVEA